jgi:hypothetical protein
MRDLHILSLPVSTFRLHRSDTTFSAHLLGISDPFASNQILPYFPLRAFFPLQSTKMGLPHETLPRQRGGFGRLSYSGTRPWPEVPVGNHEHDSAAVVIIGGGIAGMCMAIDLLRNRKIKSFIIIEKGGGFGGTWRDNKFPGCCCDVWSHLYCYSFEQNPDWSRAYPGQEEIMVSL